MHSSQPILSLIDLKDKFKQFKALHEKKLICTNLLADFYEIFKKVNEDPVQILYPGGEQQSSATELRKFFFEEFVGGITKRITAPTSVSDEELFIIENIVMVLCDLFMKEIVRDNSDMADAMRCIFDPSQLIHQQFFQSQENLLQQDDPQLMNKMSEEEREWRMSLKVGSQIDAIKFDQENNLKCWSKARIVQSIGNGNYFQVQFECDVNRFMRDLTRYSVEIARYNTMSEGDEWRKELKVGDLIDAYDTTKVWYSSTIIDKEIKEEDNQTITFIKIGFRVYDPEGNKEEEVTKKKYYGWSERFDEWVSCYNPRIQKYSTLAKSWEYSLSQTQYDENLDDQLDVLLYSKNMKKTVFAILRKKCRSTLLVQFLNSFGEKGGFQLLLERISHQGEDSMGLDTLFYYLDCLANSSNMINKTFLMEYLPKLNIAVRNKVLNATEMQLRNIRKDRIDGIVHSLIDVLFNRLVTFKQRDLDKNLFNLDIGCVFLKVNFLEKKIDGAKLIQETCRNANLATYQYSSETVYNNQNKQQALMYMAEVIKRVKQNDVLYQMFSKERAHLQLVQRSEELLKLLINQNALSEEELELIWSSSKIDEATKLELYKVLNEISSRMKINQITFIIERLGQKKLENVIIEEIELVHELAKRSRSAETEYGDLAVQFMWKIAFNSQNKISSDLVNQGALALTDIIKHWDNEHKLKYVEKLIQNLKDNYEGFLSIKMLIRILKDFSGSQPQALQLEKQDEEQMQVDQEIGHQYDRFQSKSTFIEYLFQRQNLMEAFFSNFQHYLDRVNDVINNKLSEDPNFEVNTLSEKCLAEKFVHNDQLSERLEFIKYIGSCSSVKITKDHLALIWDYLVVRSQLQSDKECMFRWLREICDVHAQYNCVIDIKDLIQFFKEKMTGGSNSLIHLTTEGFNCIQSFFLLLNETSKKIRKLNQQSSSNGCQNNQKFTSYSNAAGGQYNSFSFSQTKNQNNTTEPEDIEIQVLTHPHNLEGLEGIWTIATDSNDKKVSERASSLLIKLYTNALYSLEDQIPHFEDAFIQNCMAGILQMYQIIRERSQDEKEETAKVQKNLSAFSTSTVMTKVLPFEERKILKYLLLIKEIIKNSEKEGTHGLRPHSALFKGEYLHCLQISNSVKNGNKYQSKVEIGCYSNSTLWELRKLIGERVSRVYNQDGSYIQEPPAHPATIRIFRFIGSSDIKEVENGKTLAELRFKPNESLSAYRRNNYTLNKVPLMTDDGNDLSETAKNIFKQWFINYSVPDLKQPGRRIMTAMTCTDFIRSCTEDNCSEDDSRVVRFFQMCDPDGDGKVLEEGFLEFYRNSSRDKEEVVRQNLLAHGYRYDLKQAPLDGSDDNVMQIRNSKEDMPRYKIANNSEYFDVFFLLLDLGGEVSNQSWNLIKILTTNPNLYQKVLHLEKQENFKWSDIFDSTSIYKMLYSLNVVESLLEEEQSSVDIFSEEGQLKKDWTERFLTLGGFQEILQLFHNALDLLSKKPVDALNKYEKNFLEFMLKMIRVFLMTAFTSVDPSFQQVLQLVRKRSSINEAAKGDQNEQKVSQSQTNTQDAYKTPAKQVKGKFVDQKRAQVNAATGYQPDITQDFLFGKDDNKTTENQQQESTLEVKNDAILDGEEKQFEDSKRFSELANIMKQSGLGEFIISQIDYKDLQNQVLEVICLILAKREITTEDKQIVENSLGLWMATLLRNQNLIDDFYNFKRSEEKAGLFGIKNAEQFIIQGIYSYKNIRVREEFVNSISCICQEVTNNEGKLPIFYFIEVLQNNFPREDQYYATRECKQFFDLFTKLVELYFNSNQSEKFLQQDRLDAFKLLTDVINKLQRHESKEKKTSILEDMTLIGYLKLIEKIVGYLTKIDRKRTIQVLEETNLLDEIFYENLFYLPNKTRNRNENKCKTKESRPVAFGLLQKYIEALEPKELAEFLEFYLWPLIENIQKPKRWKYIPADQSRTQGFSGIINLGCICYMNSMLQQFYMIPTFRYQLLRAIDQSPPDIQEYKGLKIDDNLLRQLQKMYGFLDLSERHAFDPTEFCFSFKDFEGIPTNTAIQQDAQEFLNIFFDRIEQYLKPTSQKHLLDTIFGGKNCSQLICQNCGNVRNILESYFNLSLPVKDRKGLYDSLEKMIEPSVINDYVCENCQQRTDVVKRNFIADTPNILIVHLQRFVFNFDNFNNEKVNSRFEFPNVLDLKNYSFKNVMNAENRPESELLGETVRHLMNVDDEEYIFKLVGVIIHEGTAEHGHYFSLINTKRGNDETDESKPEWLQTDRDTWKIFEDDKIKSYSFSDLRVDSFGGSSSSNYNNDNEMNAYLTNSGSSYGKNAYMLVYERKKKSNLKHIVLETEAKEAQATLECADTAPSRDVEDADRDHSNNQDGFRMINFKAVTPYIPDWIQQMIFEDNTSFLMDKHIYNETFFNMIKGVFRHISTNILYTQHHYDYQYVQYFVRLKKITLQIARKTMFEMLSYYNSNTAMNDMNNSLSSIIQFCDSYISLSRGDESILLDFVKEAYLNDNCQAFFNIMFNCPDKTSRYYIGKLTSNIINKIFQIYQDTPEEFKENEHIKDLVEGAEQFFYLTIIALKSQECQKNWSRLEHFFKLIYDIGTGGPHQTNYLLTKFDIIVDLIDFVLGSKSPLAGQNGERRTSMGAGQSNPPFESIVALVCYLIRFSLTPEMKKDEPFWNQTDNLPPKTLLGYQIQETDEQRVEKYPLTQQSFTFFTHPEFIDKVLKEGYECEELGKALAHFCYKNHKFSKKISKLLLKGISRNDYEKIKNFLDVVTQVALVKDDYQRIRLEWIFGFGSLYSQTQAFNQQNPQTKLGVQILNSMTDEAYGFKSGLIIDSNTDDALLHLLWRYKGRMDTYTVSCLFSLINLIAQDVNVAEYFSELPGPSYCLARYTDWIKPYLLEQLVEARKGYSGTFSQNKEEVVIKTLSLYEKYELFLLERDKVPNTYEYPIEVEQPKEISQNQEEIIEMDSVEENVRNLIQPNENQHQNTVRAVDTKSQTIIPCEPQPYVIIECIGEEIIKQQDMDGVIFSTSALSCLYTMSKPTGSNNLSIPQKLFKNYQNSYQATRGNTQQTSHRQVEQELQSNSIKNHFHSSTFKGSKVADSSMQTNNDQTSIPLKVVEDDNAQWEQVNKMNVSDNDMNERDREDQEIFDEDYDKMYGDHPQGKDQRNSNQIIVEEEREVSYKIQVVESQDAVDKDQAVNLPMKDIQPEFVDAINDYQQNQEEHHEITPKIIVNGSIEGQGSYLQIIQEQDENIVWPNDVLSCQDLVYKFSVNNTREAPIKVYLSFIANQDHKDINLLWSRSGMKTVVFGKSSKTLMLMPKIRPIETSEDQILEIEKLNVEFYWKEKLKSQIAQSINSNVQVYPQRHSQSQNVAQYDPQTQDHQPEISTSKDIQGTQTDSGYQADVQMEIPQNETEITLTFIADESELPKAPSGQKACPQCTVFNHIDGQQCYICDFDFT